MPGTKTNERPGTRAVLRSSRMSASKARVVLDLIRGQEVGRAAEILRFSERDAAEVVGKVLASAVANAENNDQLDPEELYVAACFADEGSTLKRWRPRARGRATRIRKRTCHITVIVARMPEEMLRRQRARRDAAQSVLRERRVAGGRRERRKGGDAPAPQPALEAEPTQAGPIEAETDKTELGGGEASEAGRSADVATEEAAGDEAAHDGAPQEATHEEGSSDEGSSGSEQ